MNELHLFAGAGGGILGGMLLGHRCVCAVEIDQYARSVLIARQNDGSLPPFPIWDDVCTFDGTPWRGIVDVVCGGFPCQDISAAGKGAGITGERSGLWKEFARIIGEVRPSYVFVENSPMLTIRGLGTVLGDLAAMGFDAEYGVLSAADVGANHRRERIWILAHSNGDRGATRTQEQMRGVVSNVNRLSATEESGRELVECGADGDCDVAYTNSERRKELHAPAITDKSRQSNRGDFAEGCGREIVADPWKQHWNGWGDRSSWWKREPQEALRDAGRGRGQENGVSIPESELGRVAYGLAFTLERLKAIGNGQVPLCAATAFNLLMGRINQQWGKK